MSSVVENYYKIKNTLPENVKLVVVTKTQPIEKILEIYNIGHKIFGENKVQELKEKKNYYQMI